MRHTAGVFSTESADEEFTLVIGDLESGELRPVYGPDDFLGQPRWSPDGRWIGFSGPEFKDIVVITAAGAVVRVIDPDIRPRGGVVSVGWLDDETVVFGHLAGAFVYADVPSATVTKMQFFEPELEVFPAIPTVVR